jgi:CHAT domain-containing protein
MNPPKDGNYDRQREQIAELTTREEALSKHLGQLTGQGYRKDPWVSLAEVQKALPEDAVLVEIVRFGIFNFKAKGQEKKWYPAHYAAWIIPMSGKDEVRLIDLGEAETIEKAIKDFRAVIQSSASSDPKDEAGMEKKVRGLLEAISKRVLVPLEPYIGKTQQWLISPDGALWLVPWEALPLKDGSYALEKHRISYLVSGRDLVTPGRKRTPLPTLVMADPDYDLGPDQSKKAEKDPVDGITRSGDLTNMHWSRLAGTAREAQAIVPRLKTYTKTDPKVYLEKAASENIFKAAQSPRVVVLSTHGFFLADQDYENMPIPPDNSNRGIFIAADRRPIQPTTQPVRIENPLLRCGLVLAGANRRSQMDGRNDGILTGLEIVGTDLRGTDLVVLSACETGVGKVLNGEGVAGLRQSFQLAGTRTVVATLWKIPDTETTELMVKFFDGLAAGKGKGDALRDAQLDMIRQHREKYNAAHPFYWAAFTLTGEWK